MKTFKLYTVILFTGVLLTSCFEDTKVVFEDTQVEFEDAVMRARATGQIFPIIALTRTSAAPAYQINLIGEQLALAEDVSYSLDAVPATLLNATTIAAVEGVHFTLNGNSISFPEKASVTPLSAFTIDPGFPAQAGMTAIFILKLDGNDRLAPAENFRRLGFRIALD
jgi:hypothetical protein